MRMIKHYVLCVVCVVCAVAIACGVTAADANARKVSFDDSKSRQVFVSSSGRVTDTTGKSYFSADKIKSGVESVLSLSPPPVSNIYWFVESLAEIILGKALFMPKYQKAR